MPATTTLIGIAALVLGASTVAAERSANPYAGQQARSIKALSDDEVAALRNGDGMGMAKAAELNGYPGQRHVLAIAGELRLNDAQVGQVSGILDRMCTAG